MLLTVSALALAAALFAQAEVPAPPRADPFEPLRQLIGTWEGTGEGVSGASRVAREYEAVLGGRFIQARNRSTYAPQEKNPKGEVHEDIGLFSFDRAAKRIVLRQFHVEGFVNHYVQEPPTENGVVVFTSEAIENIPAGFRARETYRFTGPDEFTEVFEIAEPGKEFGVYSRAALRRKK